MIFPIGDDNSDRTITPFVNYMLIVINLLVFFLLQGATGNNQFTAGFATVPEEIRTGRDVSGSIPIKVGTQEVPLKLAETPSPVYITLLTSMFMHGGLMHLFGNILFRGYLVTILKTRWDESGI
jgi:membrane associated rhomboid family serine protease